jgi:hypothetical protein
MSAYTYGKLITDPIFVQLGTTGIIAPSAVSGAGSFQNPYNLRADRCVDANDVTHRLSVAAMYPLPFGKGKKFLNRGTTLNSLLSGIQLTTVMVAESGRPIGLSLSDSITYNVIAHRPNYVSGVPTNLKHKTRAAWFNTAAFTTPPDYSYGNTPRFDTHMRGPGTLNFNTSFIKNGKLTAKTRYQFRIEAFNVFNKVNLGMPNTSFVAGPAPGNPSAEGGANTSGTFGTISSSQSARIIQLALRFTF